MCSSPTSACPRSTASSSSSSSDDFRPSRAGARRRSPSPPMREGRTSRARPRAGFERHVMKPVDPRPSCRRSRASRAGPSRHASSRQRHGALRLIGAWPVEPSGPRGRRCARSGKLAYVRPHRRGRPRVRVPSPGGERIRASWRRRELLRGRRRRRRRRRRLRRRSGFSGGFGGGGLHGSSSVGGSGSGVVVLLVLVGLIVFVAIMQQRQRLAAAGVDALEGRPAPLATSAPAASSLDVLRARDPALTEESIVDHVRQMADILQAGLVRGRHAPCPSVRERRRPEPISGPARADAAGEPAQRDERRERALGDRRGRRERGAARRGPRSRHGAGPRHRGPRRRDRRDRSDRALAHAPIEPYTEIWSLVRRTGAQSKPAGFRRRTRVPVVRRAARRRRDHQVPLLRDARVLGGARLGPRGDHAARRVAAGEASRATSAVEALRPPMRPGGVAARGARGPRLVRVLEVGAGRPRRRGLAPPKVRVALRCSRAPDAAPAGHARRQRRRGGRRGPRRLRAGRADGFDRVYVEILWSARFGRDASSRPPPGGHAPRPPDRAPSRGSR